MDNTVLESSAASGTASELLQVNKENLSLIPSSIRKPSYDRASVQPGIVHIGVGGFHRSHQSVYLEDYLSNNAQDQNWGICGVGLLPQDAHMAEVMHSQDCLYTVVERAPTSDSPRIVGSHVDYIHAPTQSEKLFDTLVAETTKIVSLTITEAGYCLNQATGELDEEHPVIVADKSNPQSPKGAFGTIVEGLRRRRELGRAPYTIMSCDNLKGNGDITRKMILSYAALVDEELAKWIEQNCAFPNSMVDRITPATTDADREFLQKEYGLVDAWPVVCEDFIQWIVEDKFSNGRPQWESVGVQMTPDVHPYEKMKLRLLNASHSLMGYLGYLAGFRYIDQIAVDKNFGTYVRSFMDEEATPTLDEVPGVDLVAYKQTLMERFSNPKIGDQASRICLDGSGKIPTFLLPTMEAQLASDGPIRHGALCLAAWFRYLSGEDEEGNKIVIEDPMAELLQKKALEGGKDPRALLSIEELFGSLASSERFVGEVSTLLSSLYEKGAKETLQQQLAS